MSGSTVEIQDLRREFECAVRSLILSGLEEHWGTVDPTLNADLDDLAAAYSGGRVVAACDRGEVVGTGIVFPRDGLSAEIVRMSVAQAYRRTGLGRRLVGELVTTARGWGMARVVLETSAHWTDVIEFYRRCGFTLTHHEHGEFGRDAWFEMRLVDG